MRFTIRMKLFTVILFLSIFLIGLGTLTYVENKIIAEKMERLSTDSIPQTVDMLRLQVCVVQIQQWLTDISATRAAEGLDDGFDEAKKYYEEGTEIITRLQKLMNGNEIVDKLQKDLDDFYEMGKKMADCYINEGTKEGNAFMATFDPFAATINEEVQKLVDVVQLELNTQSSSTSKQILENTKVLLISFIVVLIVAIIYMIWVSRSITTAIKKVVKMLKNISSGQGDLTNRLHVKSNDELRDLAVYFNKFIESLHGIIGNMVHSIDTVDVSSAQVNMTVDAANQGICEASGNLEKATEVMDITSRSIGEMSVGIQQMVSQMQQITDDVSVTTQKSKIIHTNSDQGMKNMQEVTTIMSSVDDETKSAFEAIEALDKASEEVEKVVEMVRGIADETRLLALNANIEAARAGEQGKGFAVVAAQVSKLADESISSVDQIVSIIEHIQNKSKLSFVSMRTGRELINGATGKVVAASEQFTEISTEIGQITSLMTELLDSTETLNNSAKQVSITMDQMVEDTTFVNGQLSHVSATMEEQVASMEEVAASMEEVKAMTTDLKSETGQFII